MKWYITSIGIVIVLMTIMWGIDSIIADENNPVLTQNPIIWADVPDMAMIRIGDTYYMSGTTMHMVPGLPIMKSKNLVDWDLCNYAYDLLEDNDELSLRNGKNAYGKREHSRFVAFHGGVKCEEFRHFVGFSVSAPPSLRL